MTDKLFYLLLIIYVNAVIAQSSNTAITNKTINDISNPQKTDSLLQKLWEIDRKNNSSTEIILANDKLFSCSDDGSVYCYDMKGKEKWANDLMGSIKNNAVQYKDIFLSATVEGDIYSINSNNGEVIQVLGIGENITTDLSLIDLTNFSYQSKGVVFGTSEGNIFCYDIYTFELIWKLNISKHLLIAKPEVSGDKIIIIDSFASLYCVSAKSGTLIWKYEFKSNENFDFKKLPLCDGKTVFTLTPNHELIAIDLLLGEKIWSTPELKIVNSISFYDGKQNLILLDKQGIIMILSAKDGKEIQKIELKKLDVFSFQYEELDNFKLIGFSDGAVYRIEINKIITELISANNVAITSLKIISDKNFIVSKSNGIITSYKNN